MNVSGVPAAVKLVRFQKFNHTHFVVPNVSRRLNRTIEGSESGETGVQQPQSLNGACADVGSMNLGDISEVVIRHDDCRRPLRAESIATHLSS